MTRRNSPHSSHDSLVIRFVSSYAQSFHQPVGKQVFLASRRIQNQISSFMAPDMGTTQILFDSIQLNLKKFWFDSTHDSQWLYKNWLKSAHDSKSISEIWSKSTYDSKSFQNILIQIISRLKKTLRNFDSNWLMTENNRLEYWFESSHDSVIRINCWYFLDLFRVFTQFRWHFLGFN